MAGKAKVDKAAFRDFFSLIRAGDEPGGKGIPGSRAERGDSVNPTSPKKDNDHAKSPFESRCEYHDRLPDDRCVQE